MKKLSSGSDRPGSQVAGSRVHQRGKIIGGDPPPPMAGTADHPIVVSDAGQGLAGTGFGLARGRDDWEN